MALKPTSKKTTKPTATTKSVVSSKPTATKAPKATAQAAPVAASQPVPKAAPTPAPKPAPAMASNPAPTPKAIAPVKRFVEPAKNGNKQVNFTYFAPQAGSVLLAGDFTKWEASPVALQKQETGIWTTTLALPPGRYQYRLLVDGQWQDDPECRDLQPNEFGSANCVRQVAA